MTAQTHTAARAQKLLRRKGALTPLILVMGFIGASLRYLLECALPANGGFPAATLVINIFGCFVLELVNQYVGRRMHLPGALVTRLVGCAVLVVAAVVVFGWLEDVAARRPAQLWPRLPSARASRPSGRLRPAVIDLRARNGSRVPTPQSASSGAANPASDTSGRGPM